MLLQDGRAFEARAAYDAKNLYCRFDVTVPHGLTNGQANPQIIFRIGLPKALMRSPNSRTHAGPRFWPQRIFFSLHSLIIAGIYRRSSLWHSKNCRSTGRMYRPIACGALPSDGAVGAIGQHIFSRWPGCVFPMDRI